MPDRDAIAAYLNSTRRRKWRRASGNAAGNRRFAVLTGEDSGFIGFGTALASVETGKLTGQPLRSAPLVEFLQDTASNDLVVSFEGDVASEVADYDIAIEGVEYVPTSAWSFGGTVTQCTVAALPLTLRVNTYYRVEFV